MTTVFKGWNAKLYIDDLEIACAESVTIDVNNNLDDYFCLGLRSPYCTTQGNQEITGSLDHAWVNIYYLKLLGLRFEAAEQTSLPKFMLVVKADSSVGAPIVYLYDCQFEKGSLDIPQDGVLKESYDFRAATIFVKEVTA